MTDLLALWRKQTVETDPVVPAAPAVVPHAMTALPASPQTDQIKIIVDEVLDAAIAFTVTRPFLHMALGVVKSGLDLLWPAIFPAASAKLAARGIKV